MNYKQVFNFIIIYIILLIICYLLVSFVKVDILWMKALLGPKREGDRIVFVLSLIMVFCIAKLIQLTIKINK